MVADIKNSDRQPPSAVNFDKGVVTGWINYLYDELMIANENINTLHAALKESEAVIQALEKRVDNLNQKVPVAKPVEPTTPPSRRRTP